MPGYFGDGDFDSTQPADSDPVKRGAEWIRDVKRRLKTFCGAMFDLDTGLFKDNVVPSDALQDMEGLFSAGKTSGEFTQVTVNSKGLVTAGSDTADQQRARIYRAIYTFDSGGKYDTDSGVTNVTGTLVNYSGGVNQAPFNYSTHDTLTGAQCRKYTLTIPANVHRIHAKVIGAGGGASKGGGTDYGGGGGSHAEANLAVTPAETLTILVGDGGTHATNGGTGNPGCPSGIFLSDGTYMDGNSGLGATSSSGGGVDTNTPASSNVNVFEIPGVAGGANLFGKTGSYLWPHGSGGLASGGGWADDGAKGFVLIEWMV